MFLISWLSQIWFSKMLIYSSWHWFLCVYSRHAFLSMFYFLHFIFLFASFSTAKWKLLLPSCALGCRKEPPHDQSISPTSWWWKQKDKLCRNVSGGMFCFLLCLVCSICITLETNEFHRLHSHLQLHCLSLCVMFNFLALLDTATPNCYNHLWLCCDIVGNIYTFIQSNLHCIQGMCFISSGAREMSKI